nr:hypothetical protein Iba_scaffold10073CG0470 [Ipomoea batatas]
MKILARLALTIILCLGKTYPFFFSSSLYRSLARPAPPLYIPLCPDIDRFLHSSARQASFSQLVSKSNSLSDRLTQFFQSVDRLDPCTRFVGPPGSPS